MNMLTKPKFEQYFKEVLLPRFYRKYESISNKPDKRRRRELWDDEIVLAIGDKNIPASAQNWSRPKWLEIYIPPNYRKKIVDFGYVFDWEIELEPLEDIVGDLDPGDFDHAEYVILRDPQDGIVAMSLGGVLFPHDNETYPWDEIRAEIEEQLAEEILTDPKFDFDPKTGISSLKKNPHKQTAIEIFKMLEMAGADGAAVRADIFNGLSSGTIKGVPQLHADLSRPVPDRMVRFVQLGGWYGNWYTVAQIVSIERVEQESNPDRIYTGGTLADGSAYPGCSCTETHLRWHYCACGARQLHNEALAQEIIPTLSEDQIKAMTVLHSAIPLRMANRVGYGLRKLGLSTGNNRSGDNAEVLTELGEAVQSTLLSAQR